MAKKGGGGRKYVRDNRGRFSSTGATARGGRLATASGNKRKAQTAKAASAKPSGAIKGKVKRDPGAAANIGRSKSPTPQAVQVQKKSATKPDLSQSAFEKRAVATEKRAQVAEKALSQLDRFNPANRKAANRAMALRGAADSYKSLARRGKSGDFPASQLFRARGRYSTAPKLSRSEKAASTRRANIAKRTQESIRQMERARR